jgi:hypothetical protein
VVLLVDIAVPRMNKIEFIKKYREVAPKATDQAISRRGRKSWSESESESEYKKNESEGNKNWNESEYKKNESEDKKNQGNSSSSLARMRASFLPICNSRLLHSLKQTKSYSLRLQVML